MSGTSYEEHPTPGNPDDGSKFDSRHASRAGGSIREAKRMIGKLIDFLSPFEKTRIPIDGKMHTILAIEEGGAESTTEAVWCHRRVDGSIIEILIGTVSGLGWGAAAPRGLDPGEWHEMRIPKDGPRQAILLTFVFNPAIELRTYNVLADAWAITHGGARLEGDANDYVLSSVRADSIPDPILPTVNPTSGDILTTATYSLVLGYSGGDLGEICNFSGPININHCAPSTFVAQDSNA